MNDGMKVQGPKSPKNHMRTEYKAPDQVKAKVDKKPDEMGHQGKPAVGKGTKCMPGQMYVPKKVHNESTFAGEQKQKDMY